MKPGDHAARPSGGQELLVGAVLAAAAAAFWLWMWTAQGAMTTRDSSGYLTLARALLEGHAAVSERPDRTPGYPFLLLGCHGLAVLGGWDRLAVVVVVQTILLSGIGTWLVFDIGRRLGGLPVGVGAALLYATDADLQMFGRYVLSEAQAVTLLAGAAWLRMRDGDWKRARWAAAMLALTRPNLACVAGALAGLELVRGRARPALSLLWPTLALLAGWVVFAEATGGSPIDASRRIQALCQFGTAYEVKLWRSLPPGELRDTLEAAAQTHRRAYVAAGRLTGQLDAWNPGADWRPIASAAAAMIRADPAGYAWARLSLVPLVHTVPAIPWPVLLNAAPTVPPNPWQAYARVSRPYRWVFFGSFALFTAVLGVALWNGWGVAAAVEPMRDVIAPIIVVVWVSTAMLSLGSYEIGRLGLPARPLTAVVWALALSRVLRTRRAIDPAAPPY